MRLHGLQLAFWGTVAGVAALLGASEAAAGVVVLPTVHPFNLRGTVAGQGFNRNGDEIIGKGSGNQKELAEDCLNRSLSRDEKVVLIADCGDLTPESTVVEIWVVDTNPVGTVVPIGGATLDRVAFAVNRDGAITQAEYFMNGGIGCDEINLSFSGFARARFTQLDRTDPNSPFCLQSATARALGTGVVEGTAVVIENLNANVGPRSRTIDLTP
jgi:hypothetical protein